MKKVLVISLSVLSSKSSRILKEAKSLSQNGFDVLICGINYGEQMEDEVIQGVNFHRYTLKTKKLPSNFFFQIFKLIEFYKFLKRERKDFDIIDCHCLFTLLVGKWLKRKVHASKLILNAHELETERTGLTGFRKTVSKILEKYLIKYCDEVIVVSNSIEKWYKETYPKANITCIYNAPRLEKPLFTDCFRKTFNIPADEIVFLYQGGFIQGRGINLLLDTFKNLPEKYHLVFMGYGPLEKEIKDSCNNYKNIHFHEAVPQVELKNYTPSADYGFSVIQDCSINYSFCMPNKLFEYTMYEVPVIVSNTVDQSNFVRNNKIGYVLETYTSNALQELIKSLDDKTRMELKENMKTIKKSISWENQEQKLIELYR